MSDEQTKSGNGLNPAADAHGPRQATPVVDIVPPPSETSGEPEVVAAPPEDAMPPVSDEMAEQIAADAVTPPASTEIPAASQEASQSSSEALSPAEEAPAAKSEEQTSAVHEELKRQQQTHEVASISKAPNPGRGAAIAVVFATILLAAAAVFAYMSAQK